MKFKQGKYKIAQKESGMTKTVQGLLSEHFGIETLEDIKRITHLPTGMIVLDCILLQTARRAVAELEKLDGWDCSDLQNDTFKKLLFGPAKKIRIKYMLQ